MINLLIGGIGLGLVLSLMLGPVFFVLLETSIQKGIKSALYLDLGVLLSDIVYITFAYLFVNQVAGLMESEYSNYLTIVGGICFIFFGIYTLRKKVSINIGDDKILDNDEILKKNKNMKTNSPLSTILKGFLLNAVNPGVLFYWLTIIGTLRDKNEVLGLSENTTVILYLIIILITFFGIDVFKIIGAEKLKNILTPAWMNIINRVLGIILICFGVFFILNGLEGLYDIY